MTNPITPFIERQGALVLDGGLATELERRGADLSDALWSARLLADDPALIRQVHLDYYWAGADCCTSQLSGDRARLRRAGHVARRSAGTHPAVGDAGG